jgi:ABC-2 type transport system ATP-binding protein
MICDRVGIIAKGKMLAVGRIEEIVGRQKAESVEVVCDGIVGERNAVIKTKAQRLLQRGNRCWMVLPDQTEVESVLEAIRRSGAKLISVIPHKGSLEDIFLAETKVSR